LVITGASGLGKSALIANWIKKTQQVEQCFELVYTFVGQGYGTGDIVDLMAYINKEICEKYQLKNTLTEYRKSFRNT
jgi:preprotein translocase subunit SecA/nephrocystin-3